MRSRTGSPLPPQQVLGASSLRSAYWPRTAGSHDKWNQLLIASITTGVEALAAQVPLSDVSKILANRLEGDDDRIRGRAD
jgi:hypothetical protein